MNKHLISGFIGLFLGLTAGFIIANSINRSNSNEIGVATMNDAALPVQNAAPATSTSQSAMLPDVSEMIRKAESEPNNFATQMRTGDMYAKIGKFDRAVEFYKKGVVIQPNDFNANVVLANALFDSRQFEEAEGYYSKAININGRDVNARTDLGTTFVERSKPDYDRAIAEFKSALEIEPRHEPTLYYLGIAYFRKGDTSYAQKALTDLEQVNPSSELIGRLRQHMEQK